MKLNGRDTTACLLKVFCQMLMKMKQCQNNFLNGAIILQTLLIQTQEGHIPSIFTVVNGPYLTGFVVVVVCLFLLIVADFAQVFPDFKQQVYWKPAVWAICLIQPATWALWRSSQWDSAAFPPLFSSDWGPTCHICLHVSHCQFSGYKFISLHCPGKLSVWCFGELSALWLSGVGGQQ